MNNAPDGPDSSDAETNQLSPFPGEPGIPDLAERRRVPISRKGLLAVALLVLSLVVAAGFTFHRAVSRTTTGDDTEHKQTRDRPTAASTEPRKPEMPAIAAKAPASAAAASEPRIPAILPLEDETAEPIGVRRTSSNAHRGDVGKEVSPEDAPILLVSSRPSSPGPAVANGSPPDADANDATAGALRNLQGYQRQLQDLLDSLTRSTTLATSQAPTGALLGGMSNGGPPPGVVPNTMATQASGLFGGQLQGSSTPRVVAAMLGNRSLTLPKGTAFTCALQTKVISAASGLVGCQVQRNVYSDDGRVLLIERGSHLDGEYRISSVRPGTVRIPVLWTRVRTPLGVTVDIESPATGKLGESGIDGYVDNRWGERIGAAMLLSLIDDSVKLVIQNQTGTTSGDTIVLPSTTANTNKLAEKVLDSTINIPPLIYQNQGGIVGIYVARDVDFSSVYELRPVQR